MPGCDLAHHFVGDPADQVGRYIDRVHLGQKAFYLAHRHAACVHRNDLVVKAGKAALVPADELGLKRALAVARDVNAQGTAIGQHRLGTLAIAVIGRSAFRLELARCVTQVMAHLGAQRALKNRFLELLEDAFQFGRRHRPGNELLKQLG